jgi:hypothetical protein
MQQHRASRLRDVSDGSFSNAILEVGVDAAVRNCLLVLFAMILEGVVCESAVVCVIVLDGHAVICCESLESPLGMNCFL